MISLPIIVLDTAGDLLVFASIERAQGYLEPVDVIDREYVAYDAIGRKLNVVARGDFGPIAITLAEEEPSHEDCLRWMIVRFFGLLAVKPDYSPDDELSSLVRSLSTFTIE